MIGDDRESRIVETFATLADTLVDDYDVVDLLQNLVDTCRDVLSVSAAGIMLVDLDASGELEVVASTSEATRLIEVLQLDADAGPCMEAFTTGHPVTLADTDDAPAEWDEFRVGARRLGFRSVHALPLRLRSNIIGTLNLFRDEPGELPETNRRIARAMADVATIGILHERTLRNTEVLAQQLQRAHEARATIEQAKGVISYRRGIPVEDAFVILRDRARADGRTLDDLARDVVRRDVVL